MGTRKSARNISADSILVRNYEFEAMTMVRQWLEKEFSSHTESISQKFTDLSVVLKEGQIRGLEEVKSLLKETENRLLKEIENIMN